MPDWKHEKFAETAARYRHAALWSFGHQTARNAAETFLATLEHQTGSLPSKGGNGDARTIRATLPKGCPPVRPPR